MAAGRSGLIVSRPRHPQLMRPSAPNLRFIKQVRRSASAVSAHASSFWKALLSAWLLLAATAGSASEQRSNQFYPGQLAGSDAIDYCLYNDLTDRNHPNIRLRIPQKYARPGTRSNKCVPGINFILSFPSMEPEPSDMLNCIGDCNGRLWLSLASEVGDSWTITQRSYHFSLMNDDVLAPRHFVSSDVRTRIADARFSEVYHVDPLRAANPKSTWYVVRRGDGSLDVVIRCSRETPQIACDAKFSSSRHPGIKLTVLFLDQRLDQWRDIREATERFLDLIVAGRT